MKKHALQKSILLCLILGILSGCDAPKPNSDTSPPIRVAIIGGMTMTGMWQQLQKEFEKESGLSVEVVITGPKRILVPVFLEGKVDLLTMHSSDAATSLVADGLGTGLQPWTRNQHVIVGPPNDPAGIRGMSSGADALRRIAETQSPFVDARGSGKRFISEKLWKNAGVRPIGDWVIKDESSSPTQLVQFAKSKDAYLICGKIPVLSGKLPSEGMEILVEDDPEMRRPYVIVLANPEKFSGINEAGAQQLAAFLTSEKTKKFLRSFANEQSAGSPLFYPLP